MGTEIYWHGILDYDNRDNRKLAEVKKIHQRVEKMKEITGAQCLKHLLQTIVHSTDLSFLVQEEVSSFTGRQRPFHTTPGDPTTDPKGRVEQEGGQTGDRIGALEQDPPALQIGRQQPTLRRTACNEPLALRAAEGKLCN